MVQITDAKMKDVISKIEKLLRLAQSDNENEARNALARAQELQSKYNVSVESISMEQEDKVVEEEFNSPDTKSLNGLFRSMCAYMQDHYRVKSYLHKSWRNGEVTVKLVVVGLPFDVEIFKRTLFFAYNSMRKMADMYVKSLPDYYSRSEKSRSKNDYMHGFMVGVDRALKENETSNALMVVTPNAVIQYIDNMNLRKGSHSQRQSGGNYAAYSAGVTDGKDTMRNRDTNRLTM